MCVLRHKNGIRGLRHKGGFRVLSVAFRGVWAGVIKGVGSNFLECRRFLRLSFAEKTAINSYDFFTARFRWRLIFGFCCSFPCSCSFLGQIL